MRLHSLVQSCTGWEWSPHASFGMLTDLSTLLDRGLFVFLKQSGDKMDYNPLIGGSFSLLSRVLVCGSVLPPVHTGDCFPFSHYWTV